MPLPIPDYVPSEDFSRAERDAIQDLWGRGYAVVPRPSLTELLDIPKPVASMSYQWSDTPTKDGWTPVSCARHPGLFAPLGSSDDICVHHLYLLERPKAETDAALKAAADKARKNVDDWFERTANAGFTGSVTILGESESHPTAEVTEIGEQQSVRTKIPPDLFEHLAELLRERDRLVSAVLKASMETLSKEMPSMASLRESCLKIAIDTLHAKYAAPAAETENKIGWMGDISGTPYGPSDM